MKPHFHFISLFPEIIDHWLNTSIIGRAREAQLFDYSNYQLRDFSENKHKTVDDTAYGGGGGMVLKVEPLVRCLETIWKTVQRKNTRVIYLSPAGLPLHNKKVLDISSQMKEGVELILVCGHYEGVDQRFIDGWVDEEISIGDFVVTGGELPALLLVDSVVRQLDGTLGHAHSSSEESFSLSHEGIQQLEYPHYTRPSDFRGQTVPPVLLSGDHSLIARWRHEQSQARTLTKRPDLYRSANPPHKDS